MSGSNGDCYLIGHHEFAIAEDADRNRSCHHVHCNLWACISKMTWWHWDIEHWRESGEHYKKPVNLLAGGYACRSYQGVLWYGKGKHWRWIFRHIVECRHESMLGIYEFKCTCISFWNHFGMYELYIYIHIQNDVWFKANTTFLSWVSWIWLQTSFIIITCMT